MQCAGKHRSQNNAGDEEGWMPPYHSGIRKL